MMETDLSIVDVESDISDSSESFTNMNSPGQMSSSNTTPLTDEEINARKSDLMETINRILADMPFSGRQENYHYHTPHPFQLSDFGPIGDDPLSVFDFGDEVKENECLLGFVSSVFGPQYQNFEFSSCRDVVRLWQAYVNRDLRVIREKYTNPENFKDVEYDFYPLVSGHIVIISQGKRYFCPPGARRIFLDCSPMVQGLSRSSGLISEAIPLRPEMTQNILGLYQRYPNIFDIQNFDCLLEVLESVSSYGEEVTGNYILDQSRLFCPLFDFSVELPYLVKRTSKYCPTDDLFPRTRLIECCPGYGSLKNKTWSQNFNPVQWNPVVIAAAEACGVVIRYNTINEDAHWEHVKGQFQFPHNVTRGMTLVDNQYQPLIR